MQIVALIKAYRGEQRNHLLQTGRYRALLQTAYSRPETELGRRLNAITEVEYSCRERISDSSYELQCNPLSGGKSGISYFLAEDGIMRLAKEGAADRNSGALKEQ